MFLFYGVLRCADLLIIFGSAVLAHELWLTTSSTEVWQYYYMAGFVGALIAAIVFHLQGIYVYKAQSVPFGRLRITSLLVAWALVILSMIIVAFLFHISEYYSRAWVVLWFTIALLAMTCARIVRWAVERAWLRAGKLTRKIVIYGSGDNAATLITKLRQSGDITFKIAGYADDRPTRARDPIFARENYIGTIADLIAYGQKHPIDQIIIALPWTAEKRLLEVCKKLRPLPSDIQLAPDFNGFHLLNASFTHMGGVPLFNIFNKPLTDWNVVIKKAEDVLLGLCLFMLLSPLLGLIALAIKLDSRGPVVFRQKRYGFNNRLIEVYKFRTMYADKTDHNADRLTTPNDPRVTRIGRYLRRWSFDELPQLVNVLRGEMSIVGPRPHATGAKAADRLYEEVVDEYAARHRVKPGITGWAQVRGWRGETDTVEKIQNRVEHDLYYIEHWSLAFDIRILLLTIRAVLRPDNAY